jgi:hypothetical protein
VKTILEITTTVGAIDSCDDTVVAKFCTALAATVVDCVVETEKKQYIMSRLLVCHKLVKFSKLSGIELKNTRKTNLGQQTLLSDAIENVE